MKKKARQHKVSPVEISGISYRVLRKVHKDEGQCDYRRTRILINPRYSKASQRDTVLHEVTHAISQALRIGLKERQVALVATGLLGVLRANPHLADYLMGD